MPFDPNKPFKVVEKVSVNSGSGRKFDPSKPFKVVQKAEQAGPQETISVDLNQTGSGQMQKTPMPANPFPTLDSLAGEAVVQLGTKIDSVTGAPTRAAIGAAQEGAGLGGSLRAFVRQFGADPSKAPTGKEIAVRAGVPDEPTKFDLPLRGVENRPLQIEVSPADAAGLAVDVLADPTNLIPGTTFLKGGVKGGTTALGVTAKTAGKGVAALTPKAVRKTVREAAEVMNRFFNPKVAPDFDEMARIAEKAGINPRDLPEAIEFGPTSAISRAAVAKRAGPLGEADAAKFIETLDKVRDAVGNKLREIGGGNVLTRVEAGELIRQGFDEAVDNAMSSIRTSYNKIGQQFPGLRLTDDATAKLEKTLQRLEQKGAEQVRDAISPAQKSQGQGILNAVEAIRNAEGDYQQVVNRMRNIGDAAFKSEFRRVAEPPDVKAMKELYGAAREALVDTVRDAVPNGKKVATELQETNKQLSQFFKDAAAIERTVTNDKISLEKVFDSLVLGDTRKIQALKNILSPDIVQALKASSIDSMISKLADDGDFSFARLRGKMRGKQDVLKELFDPQELAELGEFIALGDKFGLPPTITAPPAGISGGWRNMAGEVTNAAVNAELVERLKDQARGLKPPPSPGLGAFLGFTPREQTRNISPLLRRVRNPTFGDITTKELQTIGAQEQVRQRNEERK